jgi:hypothetical protein
MATTFASIGTWWVKHAAITAIGTILFSLLVSIYAPEVRRLLHWPFRFLGQRIVESATGQAKARELYLEFFRDDAYRLVLFLAWYVLRSAISSFFWSVFTAILVSLIFRTPIGYVPFLAGFLMGDAVKLQALLRRAMGW